MSQTLTPNYNLKKYDDGDNPGAAALNSNWTSIDEQVHRRELEIETLEPDLFLEVQEAVKNKTTEAAIAARPVTANTGQLFLASDHPLLYRYDGSAWQGYNFGRRLKNPNLDTFAWRNQDTATVTTEGSTLTFTVPHDASDKLRLYKRAVPGSTPWNVDICFMPLYQGAVNYNIFGLIFYNTSNSKGVGCGFGGQVEYTTLRTADITTTWSTIGAGSVPPFTRSTIQWLRARDDGTNLKFYAGPDGINWVQMFTETRANYMGTPDEIGLFGTANAATNNTSARVLHWEVS